MSIGNNIKKLRELRNYTQTYMSIQLEISLSAYNKLERDETEISLKRLEQISEILNVSVNGIIEFNKKFLIDNVNNHNINNNNISQQSDPLVEQMRSEIEFLRSIVYKTSRLEE